MCCGLCCSIALWAQSYHVWAHHSNATSVEEQRHEASKKHLAGFANLAFLRPWTAVATHGGFALAPRAQCLEIVRRGLPGLREVLRECG